jgi:hypothetical protein
MQAIVDREIHKHSNDKEVKGNKRLKMECKL